MQTNLLALDAGARSGDAKAWFALLQGSTILAWASNPRNVTGTKEPQDYDKSITHFYLRSVELRFVFRNISVRHRIRWQFRRSQVVGLGLRWCMDDGAFG